MIDALCADDPAQVVLRAVEQAAAQCEDSTPLPAVAIPEVRALPDLVANTLWFHDPEDQCRLCSTPGHGLLIGEHGPIDDLFEPGLRLLWRHNIEAAF